MWNDACAWSRTRLPLFAGGELVGSERRKTERHLITCSQCRDRLESLRSSLSVLKTLGMDSGPRFDHPSLWPALARQIRESRREPQSRPWMPTLRPSASWWSPALAACLLVASGVFYFGYLGNRPGAALAPQSLTTVTTQPEPVKVETPTPTETPRRDDERQVADGSKNPPRNLVANPPRAQPESAR